MSYKTFSTIEEALAAGAELEALANETFPDAEVSATAEDDGKGLYVPKIIIIPRY